MTRQIQDAIVEYVLERLGGCPHNNFTDCSRCLVRWIRAALQKFTK